MARLQISLHPGLFIYFLYAAATIYEMERGYEIHFID
jgi:hypothetical protein